MDIGNGLLQYEKALLECYDRLEEIIQIYVSFRGQHPVVDEKFFEAVGIRKVNHRHTIERWFQHRRYELVNIIKQ